MSLSDISMTESPSDLPARAATPVSSSSTFSGFRRYQSIAEQSSDLPDISFNADIRDLPVIRLVNKTYLREDLLYKKKRKRTA